MIRIGTRDSVLALWQANKVKALLEAEHHVCSIVKIKSKGDLILDKPLYEIGITGVFTKTLDSALLRNEIDIAVHSMKDVPTLLPKGLVEFAVLERENPFDVLVKGPGGSNFIATGSLRRKAQWLHRYPNHEIVGIRGNINTRMKKLASSDYVGAIFAKSGLMRTNILPKTAEVLDWMVPAPAQGALVIVGKSDDMALNKIVNKLNHHESHLAVSIERAFLKTLEGGCSAPIGALAIVQGNKVRFTGIVNSLDGHTELKIEKTSEDARVELGDLYAQELLMSGGKELMKEIKSMADEK